MIKRRNWFVMNRFLLKQSLNKELELNQDKDSN